MNYLRCVRNYLRRSPALGNRCRGHSLNAHSKHAELQKQGGYGPGRTLCDKEMKAARRGTRCWSEIVRMIKMSWLFTDAALNSAKWNQLGASEAEEAALVSDEELSFPPQHKEDKSEQITNVL